MPQLCRFSEQNLSPVDKALDLRLRYKTRQPESCAMLGLRSSSEPGKSLRAKRERLHLSIRRVEQLSQKIANEKNDPAYYVPHNWICDLENGKSKPRLAKFHSLSLIYDCDINEILALFGLKVLDLGKERGVVTLPHTHLSSLPLVHSTQSSLVSKMSSQALDQTNLVHRMFQGLSEMALFLVRQAGTPDVLYGYVGTKDYTLDPIIRPGAFVQIDPHQNKVIRGVWSSEHERPVYFVELRDNRYAIGWCEIEGKHLLLVPSPKSPVSIRHLRYPQDAEIVGRVVGFAHRIVQIPSDPPTLST